MSEYENSPVVDCFVASLEQLERHEEGGRAVAGCK